MMCVVAVANLRVICHTPKWIYERRCARNSCYFISHVTLPSSCIVKTELKLCVFDEIDIRPLSLSLRLFYTQRTTGIGQMCMPMHSFLVVCVEWRETNVLCIWWNAEFPTSLLHNFHIAFSILVHSKLIQMNWNSIPVAQIHTKNKQKTVAKRIATKMVKPNALYFVKCKILCCWHVVSTFDFHDFLHDLDWCTPFKWREDDRVRRYTDRK